MNGHTMTATYLRPNGPDDAVLDHQGYPELAVFRCERCTQLVGYDHDCCCCQYTEADFGVLFS